MTTGERVKMLRKQSRLNQSELAQVLGVTQKSVSRLENDEVDTSVGMVKMLAMYFKVSTDYLIFGDEKEAA